MSFLLEDMMLVEIRENKIKEQEENLREIKKQLEEIFVTKNAVIPQEDFRRIFTKIEIAVRKLENAKTNNLSSNGKARICEEIYKNVKKIKEQYSDFFTNELIEDFAKIEVYFGWSKEIYKSRSLAEEIVKINNGDLKNISDFKKIREKFYKIIFTILKALEQYSDGAEKK